MELSFYFYVSLYCTFELALNIICSPLPLSTFLRIHDSFFLSYSFRKIIKKTLVKKSLHYLTWKKFFSYFRNTFYKEIIFWVFTKLALCFGTKRRTHVLKVAHCSLLARSCWRYGGKLPWDLLQGRGEGGTQSRLGWDLRAPSNSTK